MTLMYLMRMCPHTAFRLPRSQTRSQKVRYPQKSSNPKDLQRRSKDNKSEGPENRREIQGKEAKERVEGEGRGEGVEYPQTP
jgi:hypothetical protein